MCYLSRILFLSVFYGLSVLSVQGADFMNPLKIDEFLGEKAMTRAGREFSILAVLSNPSSETVTFQARLELPSGIRLLETENNPDKIDAHEKVTLHWKITADRPLYEEIKLKILEEDQIVAMKRLPVRFLEPKEITTENTIPEPQKAESKIMVGALNCPLWGATDYIMWGQLKKHPERTPALGFYAQENPEVADWETKWAVEHGIDFFVYCWYRDGYDANIKCRFGGALHDALFHSRFQNDIQFAIMWVNNQEAGIADEADLINNLFPWWMENYFKRNNYLKIDNKPVLAIFRPELLVKDLGSVENVRRAFDKMREACQQEGFNGLYLLGEYHGTDPQYLRMMKTLGLDYTFAYSWLIPNSPSPSQAVETQMNMIRETGKANAIPQIVTVTQGWSGWQDEGSVWKLPPEEFEILLRWAKTFIERKPAEQLGSKMILLDNWNEWSEGHYLMPCTEYGFDYLDAIRNVFTESPQPHIDLIPEDRGLGPYDTIYRTWLAEQRK